MIELMGITKTYGKGNNLVVALDDINMVVEEGEFLAIVGKSGSGKSTILNIIGALDRPSQGKVFCKELEITDMRDNALASYRNKKIGFVFQSFYLEPTFTVLENVAMPLSIAHIKKKAREKKALEVIERLGLADKANTLTKELSGGQKQRVSIARAMVNDPDIILADEPTGNLDQDTGQDVIKILQELNEEGKTIILVTHNRADANSCHRVVEIVKGRIHSVTPPFRERQQLPQDNN